MWWSGFTSLPPLFYTISHYVPGFGLTMGPRVTMPLKEGISKNAPMYTSTLAEEERPTSVANEAADRVARQ